MPEEAISYLQRHKFPVTRYLGKGKGKGTQDCVQSADGLTQVRMIAEELVASDGAQVQDADTPVEHPQAAGASKLRVSVFIHMAVSALGLSALGLHKLG